MLETGSALRLRVIDTLQGFRALEADWNTLLARYPGRTPFLSFEWMESWLRAFGGEVRIHVVVVSDEEGVRAIAPFCVRNGGRLTFLGYPQNDYADILVDPDGDHAVALIARHLYVECPAWDKAVLDQFPEEHSQWRSLAAALATQQRPHRVELADLCPAMTLEDAGEARRLYYKRRHTTYVNWFKAHGSLIYMSCRDPSGALDLLERLFDQHQSRWDGTATPSAFHRPALRAFYKNFVESMSRRGWVGLSALKLDEKDLALYLIFHFDGRFWMYKSSFDPEQAKRSPGQVSLRYVLEDALELGVREIDYCRGDEEYKARYSNLQRRNRRLILYRRRVRGMVEGAVLDLRHSRLVDLLYRHHTLRNLRARVNLRW